jgi:hypothetical protein
MQAIHRQQIRGGVSKCGSVAIKKTTQLSVTVAYLLIFFNRRIISTLYLKTSSPLLNRRNHKIDHCD